MKNRCIPLGVHSHYSLMQGTASMRALCREARRMGYPAVGLTDVNNLYGLWSFLQACEEEEIRPIIGADVRSGGRRFFCLVKGNAGYANLCRLLTRCRSGVAAESLVEEFHHELVVLATDPALLRTCREVGADGVAALTGVPCHRNSLLRQEARQLNMEAVAVNDAFFLRRDEFEIHRLLRAIDTNGKLSERCPGQAEPHAFLASPNEMARRFHPWPETVAASMDIAERCAFTRPHFGLVLPPYPGEDAAGKLRTLAFTGAEYRYGRPLTDQVISRLNHELSVIEQMGFSSYFLVVKDIIGQVHRTCGRGSGAASLVAYCLSITNVCPVKHNLYFERFLNPGRSDPPDIDVDFSWDERDGILHSVLEKFHGRAAMVANHVALQPRMAIRETAKVFGLPGAEISRITKKLPWIWRVGREKKDDYLKHISSMPQLRGISLADPWPRIFKMAEAVAGTPRNLSVHPGGVIITPDPIDDYVPIEHAPKGVPIIQWEKDGAEEAGLVKIDLLGNRSLGVIRDTVNSIREQGISFDEQALHPEDDPATRRTVALGRTMGCFYIESPATRLLQRKAKTGDFEHLVLHSSIIRPAANEFIREYLRRLHGGAWTSLHPLIGDVLDESYGIMVYQEDVSRVAVRFGFSHADADRLRKIMSKKDKQQKLDDFKLRFFAKARERNVAEETAGKIWGMMMSFDGYSFCKPHSASYAQVSFQAAYLKTHFPAQFMAAVISNQGGYYSTFAYVSEARRMGLTLLPPDVQESDDKWTGEGRRLRVGLMAVQGLSRRTMNGVINGRRQKKYAHMLDFLDRVVPDRDEALALIRCGALDRFAATDGLPVNRGRLCWLLAGWNKPGRSSAGLLFSLPVIPPELPPEDPVERLRDEYRVLGFLCSRHPITLFAEQRRNLGTVQAKDIPCHISVKKRARQRIRFMGWMVAGKIVGTKKGDPMEFLTFEDETGQVECTFFPEAYNRYCHMLHTKGPILLEGYVEEEFGACTLTVERAADRRNGFNLGAALSPVDNSRR